MRDSRRVRGIDSEPFRTGLGGERRQLFDIAGRQANFETGRCQSARDRGANARTRTDDQCGAIGNLCHDHLLMLVPEGPPKRMVDACVLCAA